MSDPDYYGNQFKWFVGVVVEVIDTTYVRVRAFGVHNMHDRTRLPNTDLPPALVLMPTTGGQSGSGHFSHDLSTGSWVFGFFADGEDCQYPVVTNSIAGSAYSMSNQHYQGGEFVGQQGQGSDVFDDGGPSGPSGPDPTNPGNVQNIPGGSNVEKVYNYIFTKLTQEGDFDPHLHTSAAVGCLQLESGMNINPQAVNPNGGAYGIAQWLSSNRVRDMVRVTGTRKPNLAQQLDFLWWEMNNTERSAKKLWLQPDNMPDSVAGFCKFERAEEVKKGHVIRSHPNYKKRLKYAYEIYNTFGAKKSSAPTRPAGTGNAVA